MFVRKNEWYSHPERWTEAEKLRERIIASGKSKVECLEQECFPFVVYAGVEKGIERFSKLVMPGLLLMIICIAIFSLSVSMGIMITYGSYVKDDVDLSRPIRQIEFFDTGVALLAGMMIIPAVYVFSGTEGMASGPSLMFCIAAKGISCYGRRRYGSWIDILCYGGLCCADFLRFDYGNPGCKLHGSVSDHQKENEFDNWSPLRRRGGCNMFGLQCIVF